VARSTPAVTILLALGAALALSGLQAQDVSSLRLVPFPKEVQFDPGSFSLNRHLLLEISQDQLPELGQEITAELALAGFAAPTIRPLKAACHVLRLSTKTRRTIRRLRLRDGATADDYALQVQPNAVTVCAAGAAGLFHGAQTLRQLIRANRQGANLPSLSIHDWPVLRWRAFQDDLTRGPSSTLSNLEEQVSIGSLLKLNIFTYYLEHQFVFQKHPVIAPKDGALTGAELQALVAFAQPLHVNILGNQQSFGHFTAILAHPEFAALRETDYLLCPTNARTYELLNDLYSEQAPLLPFPFFNVCCDETDGLGTGPSKPLANQIGPGALYVQHVRRVHDLIVTNYHKRMLMWGDIILRHPDQLSQIPKDTIMLTWGYDSRQSFEDQILPFTKAGYEFLVCPGVNGWNRVLPQFGAATTNVQNFVRDGVKHGALGMLDTAWDDDGQTFNAPNWHGFAWAAECAWTGSKTPAREFNRRVGAVLFGEKGDGFGRAIEELSTPGVEGMPNSEFWSFSFEPVKVPSIGASQAHWRERLQPVRAAIAHLESCRKEATVNADLLDYFLFGARRMALRYQRELDRLQAVLAYRNARQGPRSEALQWVERAEEVLLGSRNAHASLRDRFAELWARENKPYAMDWTLKRYEDLLAIYDTQLERLHKVRLAAKIDRLPTAQEIGLEVIEQDRVATAPLPQR
jgi:hypothetical protein